MKCADGLLAITGTHIISGFETAEDEQIPISECETHAIFVLAGSL